MLVAFPFHSGDIAAATDLLVWLGQVSGGREWRNRPKLYAQHSILLIADAGVQWLAASKLLDLASQLFGSARIVTSAAPVQGWPQGANALFAVACDECHEPWLWLEPDAIPLHRDWLDLLHAEYVRIGKRFMGCVYPGGHVAFPPHLMSGVAVYPADWTRGKEFCQAGTAFDVAMTLAVLPEAHHTVRIQHLWGEPNLPPTFPAQDQPMPKNGFTLDRLQANSVLFHRNKDGTLIERLRERMGIHSLVAPVPSRGRMRVRRTGAIGDVCAATVVAKKFAQLGYEVEFQSHPSTHCVLRRIPGIAHISEPHGAVEVDLDGAYETNKNRRRLHFAKMFVDRANENLHATVIPDSRNFAVRMTLEEHERAAQLSFLEKYPRPWTIIIPRSQNWANRTIPDGTWVNAAADIPGTKFWLALTPAPQTPVVVDLQCRHFDRAIALLGAVDLVVTVDTGPMHIAAALGTPVLAIQQASSPELHLSDQQDFQMISPPGLTCLNCQIDLCPYNAVTPPCQHIPAALISAAASTRLKIAMQDSVSAVICIWKPDARKLNKCLEHVLPQVDEVVVVVDAAGFLPREAMQHPKIRYVKPPTGNIGYGRKANYGARHTNNRQILFLNDDCYLNADVVPKLKEQMTPLVGMVAHELRYPDGTIQHGGTYRPLGVPGWGHLDHRARESRIKAPLEMENVCGASILVRRQAFYDAGGFDEDFYLYCEDNHLCLAVRQAGWKIMYTPHAVAIHEESQSTSVTQGIHNIMQESQRLLIAKWSWWFELNKNNAGMGVFE